MNASEFNLQAQVVCARREVAKRRFFYPRWITKGKITQSDAEREIACMEAILVTLTKLLMEEKRTTELPLFDQPKQP